MGVQDDYRVTCTPKPILLDSDVFIDFLRGHDQAVSFVNAHSERILVSSVTVAELHAGVGGGREDTDSLGSVFNFDATCRVRYRLRGRPAAKSWSKFCLSLSNAASAPSHLPLIEGAAQRAAWECRRAVGMLLGGLFGR